MLATLLKNVDKKMLANFPKMLTRKNVGNISKKCWNKYSQHFRKILMKKYWQQFKKLLIYTIRSEDNWNFAHPIRARLTPQPDPPVRLHDDQNGGTTIKIAIWGVFLPKVNLFSHPSAALPIVVPAGPTIPAPPPAIRVVPRAPRAGSLPHAPRRDLLAGQHDTTKALAAGLPSCSLVLRPATLAQGSRCDKPIRDNSVLSLKPLHLVIKR
jgi:hypothetical protein